MPRADDDGKLSFRVFYVAALGLIVRLLYLAEHARSPLFSYTVLDARYYDTVTGLLARGESLAEINPGFRPLLYPWLLSWLDRLAGDSAVPLAIGLQHLLGVVTTILVLLVAFRLSGSNRVAALAGLLFVLAGPPLYFEGEILLTSLTTVLCTALVFYLVGRLGGPARDAGEASPAVPRLAWLIAGLLLGLAAQTRPNVLLFALAFPVGAALWSGRGRPAKGALAAGARSAIWPTALAALGVLAALTVFGLFQKPHFGRFQLLPGAGGVNFYLGNKQGADGMIPRQDLAVTYAEGYRDSVQVFARQEYARARSLSPTQAAAVPAPDISRYWLGRGLDEIVGAPGDWLGLMARKTYFLLWNREIPNNRNYAWVSRYESSWLGRLPVRWWLLIALAPLGVAELWRHRRVGTFWVTSFLLCWGAGLVLFFVNGRYRAPMWPLMCVLAAAGAIRLWRRFGEARSRRSLGPVLGPALVVVLLAALSLVNWLRIPPPPEGRDFFYRSMAQLELGRLDEARDDARRAAELEPQEAMHHFQLGNVELRRERPRLAETAFRTAARLIPGEPRVWNNLGVALEDDGRYSEAHEAYLESIEQLAGYAPALTNAALLELRAGHTDEASGHLRLAEAAGDDSLHYLCARAFLARSQGHAQDAERFLAAARARDAEIVDRLEKESRQPIQLGPG